MSLVTSLKNLNVSPLSRCVLAVDAGDQPARPWRGTRTRSPRWPDARSPRRGAPSTSTRSRPRASRPRSPSLALMVDHGVNAIHGYCNAQISVYRGEQRAAQPSAEAPRPARRRPWHHRPAPTRRSPPRSMPCSGARSARAGLRTWARWSRCPCCSPWLRMLNQQRYGARDRSQREDQIGRSGEAIDRGAKLIGERLPRVAIDEQQAGLGLGQMEHRHDAVEVVALITVAVAKPQKESEIGEQEADSRMRGAPRPVRRRRRKMGSVSPRICPLLKPFMQTCGA